MKRKEKPEEHWGILLLNLLHDQARNVVMNLSAKERENYAIFKEHLLQADNANNRDTGQAFWTVHKERNTSLRDYFHKLRRHLDHIDQTELLKMFKDSLCHERMLQELPIDTRVYVQDKGQTSRLEACTLAERYRGVNLYYGPASQTMMHSYSRRQMAPMATIGTKRKANRRAVIVKRKEMVKGPNKETTNKQPTNSKGQCYNASSQSAKSSNKYKKDHPWKNCHKH